ncbi:MAG TPA: hemerythrin domain-containing protein [Acidimicrobiales bacterium]|nr:hemerythrin domain-containing protein [Acidimicrobiales bacterium]
MDVLEQLIIEHRVVTALLARLEAVDRSSRNHALTELVDALSTHMEVEERAVHPIIEACLGRHAATGADEEHDNVRHALSKLSELFDDDDPFAGALAELTGDFCEHVAGEEQILFPALLGSAPSEIAELGDAHQLEERVKSELAVEGFGGSY